MILLFCYDAACRSDESRFIKTHLLVDHSKIMVHKALLKRFFSVVVEPLPSSRLSISV